MSELFPKTVKSHKKKDNEKHSSLTVAIGDKCIRV